MKEDVLASAFSLLKGREMAYKAFESGIFQKNHKRAKGLKY